jgi:hypothetical protein
MLHSTLVPPLHAIFCVENSAGGGQRHAERSEETLDNRKQLIRLERMKRLIRGTDQDRFTWNYLHNIQVQKMAANWLIRRGRLGF